MVYVGATNILLLNLLIAMFTYSFDRVQRNTEGDIDVWNTMKYETIKEYYEKSPVIPPFRECFENFSGIVSMFPKKFRESLA